jgi:methanogenic corrinoid protein MtbC1
MYNRIVHKPPEDQINDIVTGATEFMNDFVAEMLQEPLTNMNKDLMIQYVKSVADRLVLSIKHEKLYNSTNPFPFMEKIGILWVTNHINPAQEHLVSNLIRQKLIVGIDKIVIDDKTNKSVLLFLPEGEFHELGLLFVCYLLKRKGIYPFYLGANMPIKDVQYLVDFKKPNYIYSHLTSVGKNFSFDKFLSEINKRFTNTPVVLSGLLANNYEKKIPQHIQFKKSLAEVMDFVAML